MEAFTLIIQNQVDDYWKNIVKKADIERMTYLPGKEIRTYLNDRSTLNTISFVIRRYLQKHYSDLLEGIAEETNLKYADLLHETRTNEGTGLNVAWPDEYVKVLAKKLSNISKKKGIVLAANAWKRYLSNHTNRLNNDSVFRIAYTLHMSVEDTLELMMANGQNPYCMRDPEQFIHYYCQKRETAFDWNHAVSLIQKYENAVEKNIYTPKDSEKGITIFLKSYVTQLIESHQTEEENDKLLIKFMASNQKEFTSVNLSVQDDFLRMAEYLACFYEVYEDGKNGYKKVLTDNKVNLSGLVKAMFSDGGWFTTSVSERQKKDGQKKGVRTSSSILRRNHSYELDDSKAKKQMEEDSPFLNNIQFFVDHYTQHIAAIDRVLRSPRNAQNVERRDIILFTYFFIKRFIEDFEADDGGMDSPFSRIEELLNRNSGLDQCMDDLSYTIREMYDEHEKEEDYHWDYINLFNIVLKYFNMHTMYMPCPFDRFIYMSLLSDDPGVITEAVLWNVEKIEDYTLKEPEHDQLFKQACLINKKTGEQVAVDRARFTIGRKRIGSGKKADYELDTDILAVSHIHTIVFFDGTDFYLSDISKVYPGTDVNRTRLNNLKLKANGELKNMDEAKGLKYIVKLKDGDVISICSEALEFKIVQ